jgi:hypothetical protein
MTVDTFANKLSGEELTLYERTKQNLYVTIDEGDLETGDPMAEAYRLWCRTAKAGAATN